MNEPIRAAFDRRIVTLRLAAILPLRQVTDGAKSSKKYKRIAASIDEIGMVEPLVVSRPKERGESHLLLDGHLRYAVLMDRNVKTARCLIADDDEAYTYNKRVNRLSTIQEHFMLVRAIEKGVPEARLAKALDLNVAMIRSRKKLLKGICPEVIELLKNKSVASTIFASLRKMKAFRQIEVAELMISTGTYTRSYAQALLAATRQKDLIDGQRLKKFKGLNPKQLALMEHEMESVQRDIKAVEETYGDDVLKLTVALGYVGKLIANAAVARHLTQFHPELLDGFRTMIANSALESVDNVAPA